MDNFRIDIMSEGAIQPAMTLAFGQWHTSGATHYAVRSASPAEDRRLARSQRMVLFWTKPSAADAIPFPFKMDAVGAADFATRWLAQADYGHKPDHDGDNGRGWRLYNECWGHVDDDSAAFVAIAPAWAMYGK